MSSSRTYTGSSDPSALSQDLDSVGRNSALLAGFLACAGVPLYIHLPRFATEQGLALGSVALLLLCLRVVDFVQDPFLGVVVDRFPRRRATFAAVSILAMGAGFGVLFAAHASFPTLVLALIVLFTGYSMATILLYGQGAERFSNQGRSAHLQLAGWREFGALCGVLLAAVLPGLLEVFLGTPAAYLVFGLSLAAAAPIVWMSTRSFWTETAERSRTALSPRALLSSGVGPLLLIAIVNALPVAITSTLFLFFVEDRLALPGYSGLFLFVFFLAAGLSAPGWSRLAASYGPRRVLLPAMVMSVLSFGWAAFLGEGAGAAFAVIAFLSGLALGADMVILPAMFANRLTRAGLPVGAAFGFWSFSGKMSLALAAGISLPLLQAAGYQPGASNGPEAMRALTVGYAIVPCVLKVFAMLVVARLSEEPVQ